MVRFIWIFLAWLLVTAAVYRHTPSNFLRAESGWYLFLSRSAPVTQNDFRKRVFTKSFSGHYTPLAFLSEFATAKIVGTRAAFWKWRQIGAVAACGASLFLLIEASGRALHLGAFQSGMCSVGLSAVLIFQPWMREFVAWPFMILQLIWLLLNTATLLGLLQIIRHPTERAWPWIAAALAYTSLHVLELSLATVAAALAVLLGFVWSERHWASNGCKSGTRSRKFERGDLFASA